MSLCVDAELEGESRGVEARLNGGAGDGHGETQNEASKNAALTMG